MACNTNINLQKDVIYSIYVRNHTQEGTFNAIIPDLDRIKALGTDIIWFMPIHPIGVKNKKGSLGCPYANKDYRTVNPEYGTLDDFKKLVDEIHARGMKCMIDVVYNHTSPDSILSEEHPEFFYRKPDGNFGNKIGDWTDVIDLDYSNKELWNYQIESLKMWAEIVDGFRCDVASFVPVAFWVQAREAVSKIKPDFIWLAETVFNSSAVFARKNGMYSARDYDMYNAFDIEYEYDIRDVFDDYLKGKVSLSNYISMLNFQEGVYPENYNKLRFLENHDVPRICSYIQSESDLINYTAMLYFLKGTTLIYAGQESENSHLPSLFDKDLIDFNTGRDLSEFMQKMYEVKKTYLDADDYFSASCDDENDIAVFERDNNNRRKIGVFSLKSKNAEVEVKIPDGNYTNVIDGTHVIVESGKFPCNGKPVVIVL